MIINPLIRKDYSDYDPRDYDFLKGYGIPSSRELQELEARRIQFQDPVDTLFPFPPCLPLQNDFVTPVCRTGLVKYFQVGRKLCSLEGRKGAIRNVTPARYCYTFFNFVGFQVAYAFSVQGKLFSNYFVRVNPIYPMFRIHKQFGLLSILHHYKFFYESMRLRLYDMELEFEDIDSKKGFGQNQNSASACNDTNLRVRFDLNFYISTVADHFYFGIKREDETAHNNVIDKKIIPIFGAAVPICLATKYKTWSGKIHYVYIRPFYYEMRSQYPRNHPRQFIKEMIFDPMTADRLKKINEVYEVPKVKPIRLELPDPTSIGSSGKANLIELAKIGLKSAIAELEIIKSMGIEGDIHKIYGNQEKWKNPDINEKEEQGLEIRNNDITTSLY